ncbi:MAG: 1-acyl-sn-glycerol-3-phosphate acyltransferase [Bacteroidetes bacterium]|nr:1-acyl-sn-glycerol-3-phosphate acyltransferase [Bacteroidota bacterium]
MKLFRVIFAPLWKTWFALCFVIPFIILFPLFYVALRTKQFSFVYKLKRVWSHIICLGSFLYPVILYKTKKYKLPKPCVVVSNHTSYLDIVFSPFYIDHTAVYMGKAELLKIPLFKYFFVYLDIPVNRKSITAAHKAFEETGKKIDEGISVVIYPEGTIGDRGKLRAFKNGAFKLAIEKQVPIVPVVNFNNWHYLENGGFFKSNGKAGIPKILVGNPINTVGMTEKNTDELKEKVYNFIAEELDKYNGEHNKHKNG